MTKPNAGDSEKTVPHSRRALKQQLRSAEQAGVTHLRRPPTSKKSAKPSTKAVRGATAPDAIARGPVGRPPLEKPGKAHAALPPTAPVVRPTTPNISSVVLPRGERIAALEIVRQEVAACVRCQELAQTRNKTVFGVGDPAARLCFLGEAPGADEDRQGEPFVGRAGQLLTKIIEACQLRREDVYILNVLKCRPPGNRNPLPDEAANCRGYLERQLEIIRPEFICCLGAVAARMLLDTPAPIGKLRKQFFNFGPSQVLCTYHPAFLLRNPNAKKDVWEDMQLLMKRMGRPVGKPS